MTGIEEQIKLEQRMVAFGVSRYRAQVERAEDKDRTADTKYATRLMHEFIKPVSDAIALYCAEKQAGPRVKYKQLLRLVDADKAAYFVLKCLFNHFTKASSLHQLASHIGTMIEDEVHFSKFHENHDKYYETIIRDFKRKGTKNYRHMHRVLTFKANEKNVNWNSWGLDARIGVGVKLIDIVMQETDLIEKKTTKSRGKTTIEIAPSAEALEWVKEFHANAEIMQPDRLPCLVPPDDWKGMQDGGYYTPQLRLLTPMVKTRSKEHKDMFTEDMGIVQDSLNTIQNVPWQINAEIYDVFKQVWAKGLTFGLPRSEPYEIPKSPVEGKDKKNFTHKDTTLFENWKAEARIIYSLEAERVAKCFQAVRVINLAEEFSKYDKFWYVYQCDFRGRIYATVAGLSPQGPDFAKGLLRFANSKPITKRGAYWLCVHGANCYGVDKVSYSERVKWVADNQEKILAVANDAMSHTDFWSNADKPWQFLAFCYEFARFKKEGPTMRTHLPISLDGSCNGLQNFSAMLRDEVGGSATNLVPADKPSDIYARVAAVCTELLEQHNCEYARLWKNLASVFNGLPRELAKRPVMTLPYGSTRQSCREYIYKYIIEYAQEYIPPERRFKASVFLCPILWEAIGKVVISARKAMDWLQESAGRVARKNKTIVWWSPIGFPVMQDRRKVLVRRVNTELAGRFYMRIGERIGTLDVAKNKLGIAPNFIHSMDACHLMMTCHKAHEYGITDFAFIHDDFGTLAPDTDTLHEALREAFVDMYGNNDPLIDFKMYNEDRTGVALTNPPMRGRLKIDQVIDSEYFFG